ncbi:hypothetical protein DFP72DRAFT_1077954 [Ephemerocybe angulata]|uniref:Uncharacterized protein n=1 Tax=Ephemerocybe angulata TaxID=980116 RepID=A0A8H6LW52_9AGAR|nr:hypothetical protein DFP72DRAFT_1077954 [Tulosesus angulatus]
MIQKGKTIVIYSGYKMPLDLFNRMMNEIPKHREFRESVGYPSGGDSLVIYGRWKRHFHPKEIRNRAPMAQIYCDGPDGDDRATHVLFMLRYIKWKGEDQFLDSPCRRSQVSSGKGV